MSSTATPVPPSAAALPGEAEKKDEPPAVPALEIVATANSPSAARKKKARRSHISKHSDVFTSTPALGSQQTIEAFAGLGTATTTAGQASTDSSVRSKRRGKRSATLGRGSFPGGLEDVAKEISTPRNGRRSSRRSGGGGLTLSKSGETLNEDNIQQPLVFSSPPSTSASDGKAPSKSRRRTRLISQGVGDATGASAAASSSSSSSPSQSAAVDVDARRHKLSLLDLAHQFGDVHLQLPSNAELFAHSYILRIRAPTFFAQILASLASSRHSAKAPARRHIHRVDWHLPAGRLLLDFLYSDELAPRGDVAAHGDPVMLVVEVLQLAVQYSLLRLAALCQAYIADNMTHERACPVLIRSAQSPTLGQLKEFMLDWCHREGKELRARHREQMQNLGVDLLQETMARFILPYDASAAPAFVQPLRPRTLVADFEQLLNEGQLQQQQQKGFPVVAGVTASVKLADAAEPIHFHPALLADHSQFLVQPLLPGQVGQDYLTDLRLRKLTAEAFKALLAYCYHWNTDFSIPVACQLATYCHDVKMGPLKEIIDDRLATATSLRVDTALGVLAVTYSKERIKDNNIAELRRACFQYMAEHFAELNFTGAKQFTASTLTPVNPSFDFLLYVQQR